MTLGTTLRVTVFPGRDLQARHSRSLSLDRDLHCQAQNHSPALPPLCCPSSLCVCLCARVCMRAFCVSVCVCVCFLSLLECYPRHDKTVTVCAECYPLLTTGGHGPRTVTSNAEPRAPYRPSSSLPALLPLTFYSCPYTSRTPPPLRASVLSPLLLRPFLFVLPTSLHSST